METCGSAVPTDAVSQERGSVTATTTVGTTQMNGTAASPPLDPTPWRPHRQVY